MCDAQAALSSLEREAKENVYAVLEPHIQYEVTINKHGQPPKYLSLSKPLTHQRTHAFDPHNISTDNEINNNDINYNRFSSFKAGPSKIRRSNKSNDKKINMYEQNYVCKTNNDIKYSKDPYFGISKDRSNAKNSEFNAQISRHDDSRNSKSYSRMYERNNSGKKTNINRDLRNFQTDFRRSSNRSSKENEKARSFEEYPKQNDNGDEYKPRPGKVKEIASRFNRESSGNILPLKTRERPKPLQSYGHQPYLDHVFPDAVEI